jgi:hypothetical protein
MANAKPRCSLLNAANPFIEVADGMSRKNRPKREMTKPNAITESDVRTYAKNVRSFAKKSVGLAGPNGGALIFTMPSF